MSASRLPDRHEDAARPLGADWTLDHLAGVRWLKLRTLDALLVPIRVILIGNRLLRDLRRCAGGARRRAIDRCAARCNCYGLQKRPPAKRTRGCIHLVPTTQ